MLSLGASAQEAKRLIDLDPTSFRPVQTDVLKGVPIDKIGLDNSKRPCARVKIHINRMSREDIDRLEVKVVGGNVQLTRKVTAYEGNGLIIELTAKPQTRFYLHHEKFGDSNEVSLNLEGDKEYQLEGQLNLLLTIAVATNVAEADVYVDRTFKGFTDNNGLLSVEEITPGKHLIMVKHGNSVDEREVEVSKDQISFRLTVASANALAQTKVIVPVQKSPEVPKSKKSKLLPIKSGYEQSIIVGCDFDVVNTFMIDVNLNYIGGYRVNNTLFFGLGTGLNFAVCDEEEPDIKMDHYQRQDITCPAPSIVMIPLYLHAKVYLTKGMCQPFFALSAGAKIGLSKDNYLNIWQGNIIIHKEKLSPILPFAEPAFGVNFRAKNNFGIYIQTGGLLHIRQIFDEMSETRGRIRPGVGGGFTTKIGFTF